MEQWELFENECYDYLKSTYTMYSSLFRHNGGSDSTVSDIAVYKPNGTIDFYIETKMGHAQSGQFVLLPNEDTRKFVFSPRNKSDENYLTDLIIEYMNRDFDAYNSAGTAGKALNINSSIFSSWIVDYYKKKDVKYVMSRDTSFVIFPLEKFGEYFDVSAKYRIKKSGSSEPAKKDHSMLSSYINSNYSVSNIYPDGKKLFCESTHIIAKSQFTIGNNTYYFSPKGNSTFEIKKLSNTYNMNVIFQISLHKRQDSQDLQRFENEF